MYPLMEESDLVLGYRGIRKDYNLYRKILSYGYLIFLWLLFGITVKDLNGPNIWRTKEVNKLKEIYNSHLSKIRNNSTDLPEFFEVYSSERTENENQ